jgi:hypothetical protein
MWCMGLGDCSNWNLSGYFALGMYERLCHIAKYLGYPLLKDGTLLWSPEERGRQRG